MKNIIKVLLLLVAVVSMSLGENYWKKPIEDSWTKYYPITRYHFTLSKQTRVVITLDSALNEKIDLYDSDTKFIKTSKKYRNYKNEPRNSRLVAELEAGNYFVDVTTSYGVKVGDYTITFEDAKPMTTQDIALNTTASSVWSENSRFSLKESRPTEYYTFTLTEPKRVRIELDSALYEKVILLNSDDEEIGEGHDYYSDGMGSILVKELDAGTYTIEATTSYSYSGIDMGDFTLKLKEVQPPTTQTIVVNSAVNGALTEESGLSGSNRAKEYYIFTLTEAKKVLISLDTAIDNERLRLYSDTSELIKEGANHEGDGVGAKLVAQLEAGTYTIDVTTTSFGRQYGAFKLCLEEGKPIATHPIAFNTTVAGALTKDSGLSLANATPKEYYTFTLSEKKAVEIILDSDVYNHRVRLYDDKGTLINNAYINNKILAEELEAGTYKIDVSSSSRWNELGDYNLTLGDIKSVKTHTVKINTTFNGRLTRDSGISLSESRIQENYTFTLTEKKVLKITLETYTDYNNLQIYNSENILITSGKKRHVYNNIYGSDPTGPGSSGPLISTQLLVTLEAGTYTIAATNKRNVFDGFSISLNELKFDTHAIALDSTLTGSLTLDSRWSDNSRPQENYTFTLKKKQRVFIGLNSSKWYDNKRINLYDAQGKYIASESSYDNPNNQLTVDLEAGTYTIGVTTSGGRLVSKYSLTLKKIKDYSYLIPIYGLLLP